MFLFAPKCLICDWKIFKCSWHIYFIAGGEVRKQFWQEGEKWSGTSNVATTTSVPAPGSWESFSGQFKEDRIKKMSHNFTLPPDILNSKYFLCYSFFVKLCSFSYLPWLITQTFFLLLTSTFVMPPLRGNFKQLEGGIQAVRGRGTQADT